MTAPLRIAWSLASMVLAIIAVGAVAMLPSVARSNADYAISVLWLLPGYLFFALPVWILALPFVVALKDAEGWRGWLALLIGTALGLLAIVLLLKSARGPLTWDYVARLLFHRRNGDFPLVVSLPISMLTGAFYVIGLRQATERKASAQRL